LEHLQLPVKKKRKGVEEGVFIDGRRPAKGVVVRLRRLGHC